jgi:hypothetical protein
MGQTVPQVKFLSRGMGQIFYLAPGEMVLAPSARASREGVRQAKEEPDLPIAIRLPDSKPVDLRMRFLGATPNPVIEGANPISGTTRRLTPDAF